MMCAGRVRAGCAVSLRLGGCEDLAAVPSIGRAVRVEPRVAPEADATRSLYERYANQIFRYCQHQLGSREEAEDAVQSTFLNAFRGIKRGVVPELESAWLFKIAHNVCLSRQRSAWRRGRIESPADFELIEELAPAPSRRADELIGLQDVLEQMPETQRRAILLREWQGLSYREISEELDLSQAAVETLIFRARRSLASGLEQPVQSRKRRLARAFDWGNIAAGIKSLVVGGSVAAKVAATVAVVSATTVAATAPMVHSHPHRPPVPAPKPAVKHPRTVVHRTAPASTATPTVRPTVQRVAHYAAAAAVAHHRVRHYTRVEELKAAPPVAPAHAGHAPPSHAKGSSPEHSRAPEHSAQHDAGQPGQLKPDKHSGNGKAAGQQQAAAQAHDTSVPTPAQAEADPVGQATDAQPAPQAADHGNGHGKSSG
jgi:RNA polymerase sigma factor (sigma-70 family)